MTEGRVRSAAVRRLVLSPTNYWGGLALDCVVSLALVIGGCAFASDARFAAATLVVGVLTYSLYEYGFHRWLYHGPPSLAQRIHGQHHETDALIGAPFFFSLSVAVLSWGVAWLVLPAALAAVFAGTILGSYAYQSTVHHLLHARRLRKHPLYRSLRRHHAIHHARGDVNFGLTWMFWDRIFRTRRP